MALAALLKIQNPQMQPVSSILHDAQPDAIQVSQMQDRPQTVAQAPPPAIHQVAQKTQASPATCPATQKSQALPLTHPAAQKKSQVPPATHPATQKTQPMPAAHPVTPKGKAAPTACPPAQKSQAPPAACPATQKANTSVPLLHEIQAQVQKLYPGKSSKVQKVHNNPQVVKPWVLKPKGTTG